MPTIEIFGLGLKPASKFVDKFFVELKKQEPELAKDVVIIPHTTSFVLNVNNENQPFLRMWSEELAKLERIKKVVQKFKKIDIEFA